MDADAIAKQFTDYYYNQFDNDRPSLMSLYREISMLSWEGELVQGGIAILEKLTTLPFGKVTHTVVTRDAQLSSPSNLVVLVTGKLNVDESPAIQFTQLFHLIADNNGSCYILNDVFRLVYG